MINDLSLSNSHSSLLTGNNIDQKSKNTDKLIGDLNEGVDKIKGTVNEMKDQAVRKGKQIKTKLTNFFGFLGKFGVALGAALGTVAGLTAGGVIAVTLPVSLPVLGAIAGGLFLGGAIATLIRNIRDPEIKGAWNVFTQTLKDIGSQIPAAIPPLVSFIHDPKQIGKSIKALKTFGEGLKTDVEDLKNIAVNGRNNLKDTAKRNLELLKSELEEYRKLSSEAGSCEENVSNLREHRENINKILGNLVNDEAIKNEKKLSKIVNKLQKKFTDRDLDVSFDKLDESFSGNSSKKVPSKNTQPNQRNTFGKKGEVKERETIIFDEKAKKEIDEQISNDKSIDTISLSQSGQNMVTNLVHGMKSNSTENPKAENKIENLEEGIKLNDVKNQQEVVKNDSELQLNSVLKQFENINLNALETTVKNKVQSCSKNEENQYNNILKNIETLKVFKTAINDLQRNSREIGTLNDIKNNALETIRKLKDDTFVKAQKINFDELQVSIEALKTNSGKQVEQYKMSVEIGSYKSWNMFGYNYEKNIDSSLQFNGNMIALALA